MRKGLFILCAGLFSLALMACGPSSLEIKEMSSECDFTVEVRYMQQDTIGLMVGNTLYLSTRQVVRDSLFPMLVSIRNPNNIDDNRVATTTINNSQEFTAYIGRAVPTPTHFGVVIGENVGNEIGFDEAKTVKKLSDYFRTYGGGSLVLFHEKGGELTDAKKLY